MWVSGIELFCVMVAAGGFFWSGEVSGTSAADSKAAGAF
jgi:hypothetical protein